MSYNAKEKLKSYIEELNSLPTRSKGDYLDLMRRFRSVIEQLDSTEEYPVLNFYCNWVMHPGIAKNKYGFDLLVSLNDVFVQHGGSPTSVMLLEVRRTLDLGILRTEIFDLLQSSDTAFPQLKTEWGRFERIIMDDLLEKRISLPANLGSKGAAFEAREKMRASYAAAGEREDLAVFAFYLTHKTEGVPGRPLGYYWNVVLHDSGKVEMNGPLRS